MACYISTNPWWMWCSFTSFESSVVYLFMFSLLFTWHGLNPDFVNILWNEFFLFWLLFYLKELVKWLSDVRIFPYLVFHNFSFSHIFRSQDIKYSLKHHGITGCLWQIYILKNCLCPYNHEWNRFKLYSCCRYTRLIVVTIFSLLD